jgi:hypothetical protein
MTEDAGQESMAMAEPQAEHHWLQRLAGEWTFEGEAFMGPGEPAQTMRGAITARPFGRLWLMIEDRGDPADREPRPNMYTLGYDTQNERFVGTFIDSGSTYMWAYRGSLARDVLTLESEGPSMTGPGTTAYRDVIEVVSDDHYVLRSLLPGENGQWREFMALHYRRK